MPDTVTPVPSAANGPAAPREDGERVEGLVAELLAEWRWYYERVHDGRFDRYAGEHVAIYRNAVVDHDADRVALVERAATALGVPPNHIIFPYIDPPFWTVEPA